MWKIADKFNCLRRKFRRDEKGASIVEFALVAPVFLAVTFSVFETGLLYTKIAMVDHAVSNVAREVYVGAASKGEVTYEDLEQQICEDIFLANDCENNLMLELTEITTLADLPDTQAQCEPTDINITPVVSYDPGGSSSTIFMRVCLLTEILTPGLGMGLQMTETDGNTYSIVSSTAFVNEPF